ncbi:sugar transferase [Thermodesulfobacteriota bacterium]
MLNKHPKNTILRQDDVERVAGSCISEQAIGRQLFLAGASKGALDYKSRPYISYKLSLIIMDMMMASLAFMLGDYFNIITATSYRNHAETIYLFMFGLVTISFFQNYSLYNYHIIFSKKWHFANIFKAICWAALTIGLIISIYLWPQVLTNQFFIPLTFFIVTTMMILSRFFSDHLLNFLKVMGLSFIITGIFGLINPEELPEIISNRVVIPLGLAAGLFFIIAGRYFIVHILFNIWMRRRFRRQLIIIGSDRDAKEISDHIISLDAPFWINGVIGNDFEKKLDLSVPKNVLGKLKDLPGIVKSNNIDEIIVTDETIDKHTLISLLDFCTSVGLTAWFPPKLMPIIDMKLYIDNFCGIPMIRLCSQKQSWLFSKIKLCIDAMITLPGFILISPIFLAISIAIKLNSIGPIFYLTQRIGKNARKFEMIKFRSMRINSDPGIHKEYVTKLIKGEIDNKENKKQPLKIVDDPRITSVGKLIRKLSLDELPQLINVLKGDMSLVGPRPCLPYEYEIYKEWHKKRISVRPGITGLWQVAGRSAVSFEDMILLDLYYIYNRSLGMDFGILYETVFVVLGKKGAY